MSLSWCPHGAYPTAPCSNQSLAQKNSENQNGGMCAPVRWTKSSKTILSPSIQHACIGHLPVLATVLGMGARKLEKYFMVSWERQVHVSTGRWKKGNWHLLSIFWKHDSALYAFSALLYVTTLSLLHRKKTKVQKGYLVTPSLNPEYCRVQRRPRFSLFESLHPWPTPCICEQWRHSEWSGPSRQLKQRPLGTQRAQWSCNRTSRRSAKASPRMWHLSKAMLNSWSPACWITNVLIFWLHLLGTYQSHQVKEAIILLWPPKLLKWSHLQFLHPLAAHRGFLK